MPLTDIECRNAKPGMTVRKLSDGDGLQLWIMPSGSKLWRQDYRFNNKRKLLAIGAYPSISLAVARKARDDARALVAQGIDPSEAKKQAKVERLIESEKQDCFKAVAVAYLEKLKREGRADNTIHKLEWLLSFAMPELGDMRMKDINSPLVLKVLRKVEQRKVYESARRLRSTIGAVFRYGVATALCDHDPTIALQGALTAPKTTPRAAILKPHAFGALLRSIEDFEGQPTTLVALKLMVYLFPRPGELRAAEWNEFDLEAATWEIPASRMKMRRPHRVPLPKQVVHLLKSLKPLTGNGKYVFPSIRSYTRPMSENTVNGALRRLGYSKEEVTGHGFRASASTFLNESGKWRPDVIEAALAHVSDNEIRRAYLRSDFWDDRILMMQWWVDYVDELREGGKVLLWKQN